MSLLPFPPFKALTRNGLAVTVKKTDALVRIGGHLFPLVGEFEHPNEVQFQHCMDPHGLRHWQVNGKFDMPNQHEHALDLVSFVTPYTQQGAGEIHPWPGASIYHRSGPAPIPQQDVTQPAASIPESQPIEEHIMAKTINAITVAALTSVQAAIINQARAASPDKKGQAADERKQIKREVYGVVKAKFGIPDSEKVRAATKDSSSPSYLVLHTGKKNRRGAGLAYRLGADGKWDGTYVTNSQLFPPPAPAPVEEPAKEEQLHYVNEAGDANQIEEVGQSASGFQGVAAAPSLPDGIRLVSVSDRTVVVEIDESWGHETVGSNGDRHVFTRD